MNSTTIFVSLQSIRSAPIARQMHAFRMPTTITIDMLKIITDGLSAALAHTARPVFSCSPLSVIERGPLLDIYMVY